LIEAQTSLVGFVANLRHSYGNEIRHRVLRTLLNLSEVKQHIKSMLKSNRILDCKCQTTSQKAISHHTALNRKTCATLANYRLTAATLRSV